MQLQLRVEDLHGLDDDVLDVELDQGAAGLRAVPADVQVGAGAEGVVGEGPAGDRAVLAGALEHDRGIHGDREGPVGVGQPRLVEGLGDPPPVGGGLGGHVHGRGIPLRAAGGITHERRREPEDRRAVVVGERDAAVVGDHGLQARLGAHPISELSLGVVVEDEFLAADVVARCAPGVMQPLEVPRSGPATLSF